MKEKMKKLTLKMMIFTLLALLCVLVPSIVYAQIAWDSYNSAKRKTVDNDFIAGETTVYMTGTGFQTSYSYKVAYYEADTDGAGTGDYADKVETDVVTSTAAGKLQDSECTFTAYPTANEGDWHAVVYDGVDTPPTVYDPVGPPTPVADDIFYVHAEAIPEFSTVMAAIAVAGMCFGIYYWMRKKYQKQVTMA